MPSQPNVALSPDQDDHGHESNRPSPSKRRKTSQAHHGQRAREVGLMREGIDSSASFVGSASGIHFIRSVYGAVGSSYADKTSPALNVPGEDDRLANGPENAAVKSLWSTSEVLVNFDSSSRLVCFDDLTKWTSSYFDAWHPAYPFLHAPSVLDTLEILSKHGTAKISDLDLVIVRAIVCISLADRRQTQSLTAPVPADLVFKSFDVALESTQSALTRPASFKSLQAVLCVQLFLVSMLRLSAAARLGGLIVQMAFQLGLHRCPARFSSFSINEQVLRKRMFWSIYCIERQLCQSLGMPLMIRDDDIDVCHINKEIHQAETLSTSSDTPTMLRSLVADDRLQLLAFLSSHAQIRGLIMELRNKSVGKRDQNADTAVLINARLSQWWNEVEDFLDTDEPKSSSISTLHQVVLKTLRNESIIALNRPLLALPKDTASYAGAIQSCIGAAKAVLSILFPLTTSVEIPLTWPSFTWATWMSAFVVLYGAAEDVVTPQVAGKYTSRSLKVLDKLAARGSVWPNACAVAIEELRATLNKQRGRNEVIVNMSDQNTTSTPIPESSYQANNFPHLQMSGSTSNFIMEDLWSDMGNMPVDMSQFSTNENDPFQGFDIPFWIGQDNCLAYMDN